MNGVVIHYNNNKGYGFIDSEEHEENIFVHASQLKNAKELSQGQQVEFQVEKTSRGLSAIDVLAGSTQKSPYLIFGFISLILTLSFFSLFYIYLQNHPVISYLIAVNITLFLLYGYDKMIAGTDKLRIPENNLHALALLGASPAGLTAQKFFRHKTLKGSFQLIYWLIVLLQIALLYWLR